LAEKEANCLASVWNVVLENLFMPGCGMSN
jgi:hypothetical protein